jgi:AcrR family transcriptional regulator
MAASFPRSAERTRAEILDVATVVFARGGFAGTRVDEIAARTSTTKRMIYYYFGGKEQLYQAVLERALVSLRPAVTVTATDAADPLGLIRRVTERTFAQYLAHPDYTRLVLTENLQGPRPLPTPRAEPGLPSHPPDPPYPPDPPELSDLDAFQRVLDAGVEDGVLRPGLQAADVVLVINAFCQYRVCGRSTHRTLTGVDPLDPGQAAGQQQLLTAVVLAFVAA